MISAPPAELASPGSARELFFAFNRLALQGFGGVLPVAQRELVDRLRWLDEAQFLELLSISQVLPGPNIVNLALMFGDRFFGLRGALAALAGMLLVPLGIVLSLAALYAQFSHWPWVSGALRGMGIVTAGLVVATAFKLLRGFRGNVLGWRIGGILAFLTLAATAGLHWPLVGVLAGLGSVATALAWVKLAP